MVVVGGAYLTIYLLLSPLEDPLNRNDNDKDQGNIDSSDEYVLDVSINTHDTSRSTHLTSTTDNNMDTAGCFTTHGSNHGTKRTHGHDNDTTIGLCTQD